jgi:hypothetical protein
MDLIIYHRLQIVLIIYNKFNIAVLLLLNYITGFTMHKP